MTSLLLVKFHLYCALPGPIALTLENLDIGATILVGTPWAHQQPAEQSSHAGLHALSKQECTLCRMPSIVQAESCSNIECMQICTRSASQAGNLHPPMTYIDVLYKATESDDQYDGFWGRGLLMILSSSQ